ncbi:MAG TPA: 2Fe-2S iron-sulfur cluster-binding protein [Actinomycetota bacterium]|nr:2Fe-2S iron-sulfur cluster-binding protein [Actinomycetota bacterium]
MTARRMPSGGSAIDRAAPISFTFDGEEVSAFEGDTVASAILANGLEAPFRSPILGRPRGVFSAGAEEPNAFVEISEPWFEPIVAATMVDVVDGMVVQSRSGVGRLRGDAPRGRRVEHRNAHVELLVVGSGHDGFYPARDAAARGERVVLVEQHRTIERGAGGDFRAEGVTYLTRSTALGLYDDGFVTVFERADELDRIWHVRAKRVILATGAFERSIAFADNDRPGVMLSYAAWIYQLELGVLAGSRTIVFTARAGAYGVASNLVALGGDVPAIADVSGTDPDPGLATDAEVLRGWVVSGTEGDRRLEAVHLEGPEGDRRTIACDSLLVSGGWDPNLALWRAIGGGVRFDDEVHAFVPTQGPPWLSVVGSAAGEVPNDAPYWFVPSEDTSRHFVDFQRDQTIADVADALDAGLRSVEHVKRATYIGTAIDQGRTSGVITAEVVNALLGESPGWQGPSNARPPAMPVPYVTLAGPFRGALFDPIRTTPIHPWHVERGAAFENVGQWKRPWFFAREGESMDRAVERECLAVRNAAGAMDASTLGKIEVIGADAAAFLDRMYTNRMSNLPVGSIRYGLMLGLDGMVVDDGVALRLAEDRYLVTTTTGGAALVLDRFEEWLQTEWPELRVFCTGVTEQWAVVAINGPRAREVVSATGTDVDLSREAFPFMTFRDGHIAGVPGRLARVSFSGELAYELHVPAWQGLEVWEAVIAAGEPFGIEPYGTEAMHVLRAEKGYVIVGQDTDGSVTPHDLGMDWIVNPSKGDFVGRRSLRRSDIVRPDRKQLVGLLPVDPEALVPEGAQLVLDDTGRIPMPLPGHVTSSYRSPALGRAFALAMLAGGHDMHGRTVYAPLPEGTVACEVTSPIPYDPDGERRDG